MSVELLDERTVYVRPDQADAEDILDFAIATIKAYGWRKGPRTGDLQDVEQHGASLHDAIGYACEELSQESTAPAHRQHGGSRSKDWSVRTPKGEFENLRASATEAVQKVLPQGENDVTFSDKQDNDSEILRVLGEARDNVRKEKEAA